MKSIMSDIKLACDMAEQIKTICDKHGNKPGELINILHEAQHLQGYLPEETQRIIASKLGIPVSKVYGVVTFYTFFTMTPKGKHPISVCMGTACYVRGSEKLLEEFKRVLGIEVGTENSLYIHVTLVPFLSGSDEHKSKPTQHSVKELQGMGIRPDVIVLRADEPLEESIFKKIALFCNVKPDCVIENITLPCLYEAPLMLEKSNFSSVVLRELHIDNVAEPDLNDWKQMVKDIKTAKKHVTIGLVGKYVQLHDAYLSVAEALRHAGYFLGAKVDIKWIDSETITPDSADEILSGLDGIIVPGGFGSRGIEGMILAAKYARENNVPYFGICLGMQIAVIEYARNVAGIRDAHSGEFDELCKNKVINFMPGQSDDIDKGGTLRLGAYPCVIKENTTMQRCYGTLEISERHRHRYEFNNDYREILTKNGLTLSGLSPDGRLVETVELTDRPFYVGVQFHPEFKSRPNRVHPLFKGFIEAALQK